MPTVAKGEVFSTAGPAMDTRRTDFSRPRPNVALHTGTCRTGASCAEGLATDAADADALPTASPKDANATTASATSLVPALVFPDRCSLSCMALLLSIPAAGMAACIHGAGRPLHVRSAALHVHSTQWRAPPWATFRISSQWCAMLPPACPTA